MAYPRRVIVSASRRTDIPAFYSEWFLRRLAEGFCTVPNPFNRRQVSRISLRPEDVDALVFWTRNPRPLMARLAELAAHRYYFLFTLVGNPRELDPKSPPREAAVATFRDLAGRLGPGRVVWRYDPVVFSALTPREFHLRNFAEIAEQLEGSARRVVISFVDEYRKAGGRLRALRGTPAEVLPVRDEEVAWLVPRLREVAALRGMQLQSCAEELDLRPHGVPPGRCLDGDLLRELFGIEVDRRKDSGQREACGCVRSRDIGVYDTCLFGCVYCYATRSFELAAEHHRRHDPAATSLLGVAQVSQAPLGVEGLGTPGGGRDVPSGS